MNMTRATRQGLGLKAKGMVCAVALAALPATLFSQSLSLESKVDAVFARWTSETPGCAVGVATDGKPVLAKGYGMADLEHDVRISPDSLFEAGSVSKQFTAAAVMLLAREGKLLLDDQVRTYLPELPEYPPPPDINPPGYGEASPKPQAAKAGGSPLIRHMLNHTSGLRDWGSVAGIAGWPRTTRVHTQAHMLDIRHREILANARSGVRARLFGCAGNSQRNLEWSGRSRGSCRTLRRTVSGFRCFGLLFTLFNVDGRPIVFIVSLGICLLSLAFSSNRRGLSLGLVVFTALRLLWAVGIGLSTVPRH